MRDFLYWWILLYRVNEYIVCSLIKNTWIITKINLTINLKIFTINVLFIIFIYMVIL